MGKTKLTSAAVREGRKYVDAVRAFAIANPSIKTVDVYCKGPGHAETDRLISWFFRHGMAIIDELEAARRAKPAKKGAKRK